MTNKPILPDASVTPPKITDYLPEAIQKAVVSTGIKHPATIYPIAIGAGSGFVGWLFGMPLLYLIALAGILAGPAWAISHIFFFHEKIGSAYIRQLNDQQKAYENHIRDMVGKKLRECSRISGLGEYAAHGLRQFENIREKLRNIQDLLDLKLHQQELTYGRFLGAAEQVSLSVLDNLRDIVSLMKSAESIRTDDIQEHLQKLARRTQKNEADIKQETTLRKRLELREAQCQKVSTLLTHNEEAMTEMENISAAVAEWQTHSHFADVNFESAIIRLQELAAQAGAYNITDNNFQWSVDNNQQQTTNNKQQVTTSH